MEPLRAHRTEDVVNTYVKWLGEQVDRSFATESESESSIYEGIFV